MLIVLSACAALAAGGQAEDGVSIGSLAPRRSTMLVQIPSVSALVERAREGPLDAFWTEESLKAFGLAMASDTLGDMAARLEPLGLTMEDFVWPTGHVGLAVFPNEPEEDVPLEEEEFFYDAGNGFLLVADFGERAGEAEELLDRVVSSWVDEEVIVVEELEHAGVDYRSLTDPEGAFDQEQDEVPFESRIGIYEQILIATVDGVLVMSSETKAMRGALEALAGDALEESLDDNPTLGRALAQHPAGSFVQAVALLDSDAWKSVSETYAFFLPIAPAPLIEALGLAKVEAVSAAMHVGGEDSVLEWTLGALVPEKTGLVEMLSVGQAAEPPSFVSADATSFWQINMRFEKIPDLILEIAEALPEEEREAARAGAQEAVNFIRPITDELGPQLYIVQSIELPQRFDSEVTGVAAAIKDDLAASNVLATFGEQIGLQAGDFNGNTVYAPADPQMGGPTIGLGFGHAFLGAEAGVKGLMRLAGDAAGAKLADEARYQEVARSFGPSPVLAMYMDAKQTLDRMEWSRDHYGSAAYDQFFGEEIEGFEPPPREEWIREYEESRPGYLKALPDARVLLEVLGDQGMAVWATPEGFAGRLFARRPK